MRRLGPTLLRPGALDGGETPAVGLGLASESAKKARSRVRWISLAILVAAVIGFSLNLFSLALGTGLRLCEILGLNVGDVFLTGGRPKTRIYVRREIAKRGRAGDVFLPDALTPKLVASI